jgi:hypothetical protein
MECRGRGRRASTAFQAVLVGHFKLSGLKISTIEFWLTARNCRVSCGPGGVRHVSEALAHATCIWNPHEFLYDRYIPDIYLV